MASIRCKACGNPIEATKAKPKCSCGANRWEARLYLGVDPATDRPVTPSRTYHCGRKEAKARAAREEARAKERRATKGSVGWLVRRWLDEVFTMQVENGDRSPTTLRTYRSFLGNIDGVRVPGPVMRNRPLGSLPLDAATAEHLDAFYAHMRARGLTPRTVEQHHAVLSGAFKQAIAWHYRDRNPAKDATPPRPRPKRVEALDPSIVRLFVRAGEEVNPDLAALSIVAATTGARRGELIALRESDAGADLRIRRSVVDAGGGVVVEKGTKTHSDRPVALDPMTARVVQVQVERNRARAADAGAALAADPFLFSRSLDCSTPYPPDAVTDFWRQVRKRVMGRCPECLEPRKKDAPRCACGGAYPDVARVRFHDLRHFMATQAIRAKVDIKTVSGRLGHAKASTTLDIYAHVVDAADRELADHMGALLSG